MEFPNLYPARWIPDPDSPMCLSPYDFTYSLQDMQSSYYRPWRCYNHTISRGFGSTIESEKGNCKITLDVQYFRHNEISVKVSEYQIIVEGKHEERPDTHGFVTRQFKRRYPLPNHCSPESVTSTLSSDGVLTIIAEKKSSINKMEKIVPIKLSSTLPRKTQIETKLTSEITQKAVKEGRTQEMKEIREEHSRLLKPEILNDITSKSNSNDTKTETKQSIDILKTCEKMNQLNISSSSNKIEESIEKSISGLTALTKQVAQNSSASKSEIDGMKVSSEGTCVKSALDISCPKSPPRVCPMLNSTDLSSVKSTVQISDKKSASEKSCTKNTSEESKMKNASEISETPQTLENISQIKALEMTGKENELTICGIKGALETSAMKCLSDICGVTGASKTLVENNASSSCTSSSMLSSTSVSGSKTERVCDIREELREAAENV